MHLNAAERRHLERQITYARPIFLVLVLGDLLEESPQRRGSHVDAFAIAYLALALLFVLAEQIPRLEEWRLPLAVDLAALGIFLLLPSSTAAFWFLYLFVALAAGIRWGFRRSILLACAVTMAVLLHSLYSFEGDFGWPAAFFLIPVITGTFMGGAGLSFLGDQTRRHAAEHQLLAQLTGMLQVDRGVPESLHLLLDELARDFASEKAMLAFRDPEVERIFVWTVAAGQVGRIVPENLPLSRAETFFLDQPEASICRLQGDGSGAGFGWDRRDGRRLKSLPPISLESQQLLQVRSLLSVPVDFAGQPAGRIILCNARRRFLPQDLQRLERIVRHIAPPLENLFLLRHLRTRVIEGERSRISRDIHDGILQTLLSVDIQLDVLRRKALQAPEQAAAGLATLQQTVRSETEELRRMVTDLRPLGVQSADLMDLMQGFGERFRNESGLGLDLLIDAGALQTPDRICRELFQIYREALHNVKKHAHATHVVVKLWQNEGHVVLVIDDNGEGFSFAGRFTGDELDRLRLGPISIKERTRSVGGVLTVESTPGHGARLTVEVPLG